MNLCRVSRKSQQCLSVWEKDWFVGQHLHQHRPPCLSWPFWNNNEPLDFTRSIFCSTLDITENGEKYKVRILSMTNEMHLLKQLLGQGARIHNLEVDDLSWMQIDQ